MKKMGIVFLFLFLAVTLSAQIRFGLKEDWLFQICMETPTRILL